MSTKRTSESPGRREPLARYGGPLLPVTVEVSEVSLQELLHRRSIVVDVAMLVATFHKRVQILRGETPDHNLVRSAKFEPPLSAEDVPLLQALAEQYQRRLVPHRGPLRPPLQKH